MTPARTVIGWLLVAVSVLCVIQSAREWLAWRPDARFGERDLALALPIRFAGHRIDVTDDQPTDSTSSERAVEGHLQLRLDGRPFGAPSRALVRPGRRDIGRYHTWLQATRFHDRVAGRDVLFLARRIQPSEGGRVQFEVSRLDENGAITIDSLHAWMLGQHYPVWRATQFLRANEWEAYPLAMLEAAYFPPVLLFFPIGTLIVGVALVVSGRRRARELATG